MRIHKNSLKNWGFMECSVCGEQCLKRAPIQKYCPKCSQEKDRERKLKWYKKQPKRPQTERQRKIAATRQKSMKERGVYDSSKNARSIGWFNNEAINLEWLVRVKVPFHYGMSKNAIWRTNTKGHVYLRREHKTLRNSLGWKIKSALKGIKPVLGKVWIDILVQKPDNKGDAVNTVDSVCDAVKYALGIDDRYFSIRRLDWEIVKEKPCLYVGVGQDIAEDHLYCAYCGSYLPAKTMFGKNRSSKTGYSRVCKLCSNKEIRKEYIKRGTGKATRVRLEEI